MRMYMNEEQRQADLAERRRSMRTPHTIEHRNFKARHGGLDLSLSEDGTELVICTRRTNPTKAERETIMILARRLRLPVHGYKRSKRVGFTVPMDSGRIALEAFGVVPVPAKCERCDGCGLLTADGKPETVRFSGTKVCPACHGSGRALVAEKGA